MLIEWTQRLLGKSAHTLSDAASAAQMLADLPRDEPAHALADAAAWLESLDMGQGFDISQRLTVLATIDEAAYPCVNQLTLAYVGALPRMPRARLQDWRTLSEYLQRLSGAYSAAIDAYIANPSADVATRMPVFLSRAMRAITDQMRNSWLRYLPPDRAAWENMIKYYRLAVTLKVASTMSKAYRSDIGSTCPAYEFAAAVMLTAAVPQSLTPREIELTCRLALAYAGAFARTPTPDDQSVLYIDLDQPAPPALMRAQPHEGQAILFFGPGSINAKLTPLMDKSETSRALLEQLGPEFSDSEKRAVVGHGLKFWSISAPSRREARTRINTAIQVMVGVASIQRALGHLADVPDAEGATRPGWQAAAHKWTLTDFSKHGIGARLMGRPDGWLQVGSILGFRLERSAQWAVGIVRRIRIDGQNQTDLGIEILAKATELVSLENADSAGSVTLGLVRSGAMLLPENPELQNRPSLLLQPGTYNSADNFILHRGSGARRIRLATTSESLDGWNRVDIEWLDAEKPEEGLPPTVS